ncbi:MAG: metallophosphoesterase, partial [Deltaproteobacteria bacterium]|nr:metallophosphoesterase [Deltaproteobacteria bacterium]
SSAVRIAPPDYDQADRFRVAVMGDIQTGLDEVGDIFDRIDSDPSIRFVISTGDLVQDNRIDEYEALLLAFRTMEVPYFSTIGNHELAQATERWSEFFGRHTVHFDFKGASFSFVDAGNASIDPLVYDWLDDWLDQADERIHLFGQHYPAIDPVGVRQSSMRSRKEAAKLLGMLANGNVDATFYGHLHSYYAYENAGIPAYISGGGGAYPERWDGIGRHFLVVDLDPGSARVESVGVVRVDP